VLTNLFLNAVAHAFPDGKPVRSISRCGNPARTTSKSFFPTMVAACPRRPAPRVRSVLHDAARSGRHRLGLHIVYSIVTNRLGGRLDLDSEPGGGTRIQMILPELRRWSRPRSSALSG